MEQAVTKIRETSAHTIAAYPTLASAESGIQDLANHSVPIQFATIVAEGVRSEARSVGRGLRNVFALTLLGALAATTSELVTHYWLADVPTTIDVEPLIWAAITGAIIGIIGSLFLSSSKRDRPLRADIFEIMVTDQYADQAREVLFARKEVDEHEIRTPAR